MDTELVVRAQHGDEGAFASIATVMFSRLHRVAENILGDVDMAEDAAQQAVLQVWRNLPGLREPERFEAWSYRILVNTCYREAKRSKRWIPGLTIESESDPAAASQIGGVVYRDQLERGFRRLPVEQRVVIVLHHYVGLSLREIADVLDIPRGTAHSRLYKGRTALRASLEADERMPAADARAKRAAP